MSQRVTLQPTIGAARNRTAVRFLARFELSQQQWPRARWRLCRGRRLAPEPQGQERSEAQHEQTADGNPVPWDKAGRAYAAALPPRWKYVCARSPSSVG